MTQTHVIKASNGATVNARLRGVKGKATTFTGKGVLPTQLKSVTTFGKESLTCAEKVKEELLLHFLQGCISLKDNMVFSAIWLRSPTASPLPASVLPASVTVPLNASQELAVRTVIVTGLPSPLDSKTLWKKIRKCPAQELTWPINKENGDED